MTRIEAIRAAIETSDPWLQEPGNQMMVAALAAGIEAGVNWQPPDYPPYIQGILASAALTRSRLGPVPVVIRMPRMQNLRDQVIVHLSTLTAHDIKVVEE